MHWCITARREFDRLIITKGTIIYAIISTIFGIVLLQPQNSSDVQIVGAMNIFAVFQSINHIVMPVAAVLFGYRAILKERETGSLLFTMSVPQSRWHVLIGIFIGRFTVLAVVTTGVFLIISAIGSLQYGIVSPYLFISFFVSTYVVLATHLAIGIGISALTYRSSRAATAAFGYIFISIFWLDLLVTPLYEFLSGNQVNIFAPPADPVLFILQRALPVGAGHVVTNWVLGLGNAAKNASTVLLDANGETTNAFRVSDTFQPEMVGAHSVEIPFYLHPVFSLLILLCWCLGMLVIGYLVFNRTELTAVTMSTNRLPQIRSILSGRVKTGFKYTQRDWSQSWYLTAHREVIRLMWTRGVFIYGFLFVGFGLFSMNPSMSVIDTLGPAVTVGVLQQASAFTILPTALIFGYRAISNECETSSITISMGVPQLRWNYLIGVFIGRFIILAIPTLIGYLILAILGSIRYGLVPIKPFILLCGAGLLYLAANLMFAVSISALTRQNSRSATGSVVYFIVMGYFWATLFCPLLYNVFTGTTIDPRQPPEIPMLFFLQRITPFGAFNVTTNSILGIGNAATSYTSVAIGGANAFNVIDVLGHEIPFYLDPASGPVLLLLWCILSIGVGYLGYRRADLL